MSTLTLPGKKVRNAFQTILLRKNSDIKWNKIQENKPETNFSH